VRAEAPNWNKVVLYIAPQGGGMVSDVLRQNLLAYFEDKRPITTLIEIENVKYVNIYVTARIGVRPYYDVNEVRAQCEQVAAALLAFDNVDFRQTIYLSKFYEALEGVEGVDFVTITEFRRFDQTTTIQPEGKIELGVNEIPQAPLTADPDDPTAPVYPAGVQIIVEGES
jgi:phage-related baseplate assembly protein